ncbi:MULTISPECIES: hypothetical protein [unclassified Streptomyces]|uniref:helix-hairpin-helix domain-containing protein n=1 Tax=unclassified Streptomyces TaxID=2593676 RepID=UPI0036E08B37
MSSYDKSASRPPVAGPNHTCRNQRNLCASNGIELRDLIGHDPVGHAVAGRLLSEGITTIEQLRALSREQLRLIRSLGAGGLQRLDEQGLVGAEGGRRVLLYLDPDALRLTEDEVGRLGALAAYVREQGWDVAGAYVDRPMRGEHRPRWHVAAKELASGEVDAVVVWDAAANHPVVWEGEPTEPWDS